MAPPQKPVIGKLYTMKQQHEMHRGEYQKCAPTLGGEVTLLRLKPEHNPDAQDIADSKTFLDCPDGRPDQGADAAEVAAGLRQKGPERVGVHRLTTSSRASVTDGRDACQANRRKPRRHCQLRDPSGKELTCLTACAAFGPALRSYRNSTREAREEAEAGVYRLQAGPTQVGTVAIPDVPSASRAGRYRLCIRSGPLKHARRGSMPEDPPEGESSSSRQGSRRRWFSCRKLENQPKTSPVGNR